MYEAMPYCGSGMCSNEQTTDEDIGSLWADDETGVFLTLMHENEQQGHIYITVCSFKVRPVSFYFLVVPSCSAVARWHQTGRSLVNDLTLCCCRLMTLFCLFSTPARLLCAVWVTDAHHFRFSARGHGRFCLLAYGATRQSFLPTPENSAVRISDSLFSRGSCQCSVPAREAVTWYSLVWSSDTETLHCLSLPRGLNYWCVLPSQRIHRLCLDDFLWSHLQTLQSEEDRGAERREGNFYLRGSRANIRRVFMLHCVSK